MKQVLMLDIRDDNIITVGQNFYSIDKIDKCCQRHRVSKLIGWEIDNLNNPLPIKKLNQ